MLLNDLMSEKKHRPPLTDEEIAEKRRLKLAYQAAKKEWANKGEKLTDIMIGEMVASITGREDPYSQGAVWQFTSEKSDTRIPDEFVQGMAVALNFSVESISPRFLPKESFYRHNSEYIESLTPEEIPTPTPRALSSSGSKGLVQIRQFNDVSGSMGRGIILSDQPGQITSWSATTEWVSKNVPSNTGNKNLRIVTGFGDSMRPMYNPGDPLLIDIGSNTCYVDGVYFFRVGDEGFIKRLQRIPGEGIRALSENKHYETWTIKEGADFEIFGKVLKVWCGTTF